MLPLRMGMCHENQRCGVKNSIFLLELNYESNVLVLRNWQDEKC